MTDPGYPTLLDTVLERLNADPFVSSLLVGGIYDRPLQQGAASVYGSTPNAFSTTGNRNQVRPCAVLRNQPRTPLSTFAETHIIEIWLYVPATASGKQILAQAVSAIRDALNGWIISTWDGLGGVLTWAGQTGYRDDPVYVGSLVDTVRYSATALVQVPV